MRYILGMFAALLLLPISSQAMDDKVVRLATSSSLKASGLVDVMVPAFKKATGYDMEVYAVGSGRALRWAAWDRPTWLSPTPLSRSRNLLRPVIPNCMKS